MRARALTRKVGEIGIQAEGKAADLDLVPIQGDAGNGFMAFQRGELFLERAPPPPTSEPSPAASQKQEQWRWGRRARSGWNNSCDRTRIQLHLE